MGAKKVLRFIAGGCFAVYSLIFLISQVNYIVRLSTAGSLNLTSILPNLISLFAFVLITVGLFVDLNVLAAVGSGVMILTTAITLIGYYFNMERMKGYNDGVKLYAFLLIGSIIGLVYFIMLLLTSVLPRAAKVFGFVAGGVETFLLILRLISTNLAPISYNAMSYFQCILLIAGAVLYGLSRTAKQKRPQYVPAGTYAAAAPNTLPPEKTAALIRLKESLDRGMISQQEYEERRRQILG